MPNYCYNELTFNPDDVEKVKKLVVSKHNQFDFNRIIPMPKSLNIASGSMTDDAMKLINGETITRHYPDEGDEPDPSIFFDGIRSPKTLPELRVFARLIQSNMEKYHATDWYDWCRTTWGTKWNACDAVWDGNTVHFETAWSSPDPVLKALSEKLDIEFEATAKEESLSFCSITTFANGNAWSEEASGAEGLKLLGYSKADAIAEYGDWASKEELKEVERVYAE